jgi:hypothetical protein
MHCTAVLQHFALCCDWCSPMHCAVLQHYALCSALCWNWCSSPAFGACLARHNPHIQCGPWPAASTRPALHCTALHCTALHCTALHCTALHCTALHCTALHCTALQTTACRQHSAQAFTLEAIKPVSYGQHCNALGPEGTAV